MHYAVPPLETNNTSQLMQNPEEDNCDKQYRLNFDDSVLNTIENSDI